MSLPASFGRVVRRTRRLHTRTPLRVRLVAALLLVVLAALVGAGVAATTTMRAYLVGRVDSQLQEVVQHPTAKVATSADQGGHGGHDDDRLPSAYVVEALDADGTISYGPTSDLIDAREPLPRLPAITAADGARSYNMTVPAVGGDEQWRVAVRPTTLSDGRAGTLLVAQGLGDVRGTVGRLTSLFAGIGGVAVLLIAGLGYLAVRTSLRPLDQVERTAAAIAGGDLTQRVPPIDPRTEIGRLSTALNTMLAEIEIAFTERAASEQAARRSERQVRTSETAARRSEDRMRRFVADASHELRTPLTTIRGFAELYGQGAVPADDVRRLMRRIEDEAARMGLLVEDLLLLACLDQQRPPDRAPVDLLALADDAVRDAQTTDPTHLVRLEVGGTDPPPVVSGDERRLRQVLTNLLGNAVRHTPPGTRVTVRVATEPAGVVLTVSDNGPGLTAEHAAHVFERSRSGRPGPAHAAGGHVLHPGLGLPGGLRHPPRRRARVAVRRARPAGGRHGPAAAGRGAAGAGRRRQAVGAPVRLPAAPRAHRPSPAERRARVRRGCRDRVVALPARRSRHPERAAVHDPEHALLGAAGTRVHTPRTPPWDRPAQFAVGIAVSLVALTRHRWALAILGAIAARVALDPGTNRYYAAGVLVGAVLWDVAGSRLPLPWWSGTAFASLFLLRAFPLPPYVNGIVTLAFFAGVCVLAALPRRTGARLPATSQLDGSCGKAERARVGVVPTPPRQLRRSGAVLAVLAPLVALWLGLTAPDTSPVQPAPAVQQAADPAANAGQAVPPPAGRRGGRP